MFPTFISILDIQSWWEVPSIAHFCSLFRSAFNLLDFDIEDLEEALLTDGTEETSWLQELIVRLLSGCLPKYEISTFNYQMFLRRLFRQKCQEHNTYNPFNTDIDFQLLPLRTKVDILHALCDFRLDANDVLDQLKNLEADSLRVEPLGYDSNGSAYWYFYGTRLYREDFKNKSKKEKAVWQVICFTEDDWFQLTKKFSKSISKSEKKLHRTLSKNFLPELPRLFRKKERLARKRLLENQPRRTSSRLRKVVDDITNKPEKEENLDDKAVEIKEKEENKKEEENRKKLEKRRKEAYERRAKLKEQESSQSDKSESRYEMAGAKTWNKKSKTRQRKRSESSTSSKDQGSTKSNTRGSARSNASSDNKTNTSASGSTTVGRQTNNSLACATGQIVIQSKPNTNRKKLKTSQVFSQTEEDLQTGMHKILDYVKNHEDAWPFIDPVEEEYAPNYYSIIRKPMDLQRMEERLDTGHYKSYSRFRADFQLIVDNCRLYNGVDNEYTEMVDNLLKVFERATEKYLDQISSSDDEIAVEFPESDLDSKTNNRKKKGESTTRKPTLVAQTDKKRDRSSSRDSVNKQSDSIDLCDRVKSKNKPTKINKKQSKDSKINKAPEKQSKKNEKKNAKSKHSKSPVVSSSPEQRRSLSRSFSKSPTRSHWSSSPPPSWPPSSPDSRFDFSPKKNNKRQYESSDEEVQNENKGKKKEKHDKWKEIFKDDLDQKEKKDKEILHSPKPKDKHNKLRETIEKLKAKSELSKYKEKEVKVSDTKDKQKKHDSDKMKSKSKVNKNNSKKNIDIDDENSGTDSIQSGNKKQTKKSTGAKNNVTKNAAIEALTLATEQTLKDINKWLDDTPKFSEYSSGSNSPSYIGLDEFDNIGNKIEQDFRKKLDKSIIRKDGTVIKDIKRKPFHRDPSKFLKRREVQRTIDRLQPGKSKGNLLSNIQSSNKPDDLFPLGPLSKIKDTKNSLIVKTDENAPKLSLGSVLDSFGKHKFVDDIKNENEDNKKNTVKKELTSSVKEELKVKEDILESTKVAKNVGTVELKPETILSKDTSPGKATPNLSAWFKAFGAPKVQLTQKKPEGKVEHKEPDKNEELLSKANQKSKEDPQKVLPPDPSPNPDSPLMPYGQPVPRQRKISTGSSVSERSSFSQDMDSPRVGIDERLGAYPAPYPSPLHRSPSGASPIMASPRPDVSPKAATYPTFNGQIRVGFYQDTVSTKSSPDKSCSPRDNPQSPYAQYSEHVYTPPVTTNPNVSYSYGNPQYYSQTPNYSTMNPASPYNTETNTYYDMNKPLTDQYQAKTVPNYNANSPASNVSNHSPPTPQHSPTINTFRPEKQNQSAIFPVKKRAYNDCETVQTNLNHFDTMQSNNQEQQNYNRNLEPGLVANRQGSSENINQTSPLNVSSPNNRETPKQYVHQNIPEPKMQNTQYAKSSTPISQQGLVQQSTQHENPLHNLNYPMPPNEYNHPYGNESYPINIPTTRSIDARQDLEKKYTNMGYSGSEMNFARNSQYNYTRSNVSSSATPPTETQLVPSGGQSTHGTDMSVRFTNTATAPVGYKGIDMNASSQQSHLTNLSATNIHQNTRVSAENLNTRLSQPLDVPSGYKPPEMSIPRPYNTPSSLEMDQSLSLRGNLANLSHIVDRYPTDERMLTGLQSTGPSYYTDKGLTPAHMFSKPIATSSSGLPMFTQSSMAMPYSHDMQATTSAMYNRQLTELQGSNSSVNQENKSGTLAVQQQPQERKSKRRKTAKNLQPSNPTESASSSPVQGFQSYAGLKNNPSMEPSAISLKTASVVPGSAFNFGPTPSGLSLGSGLYGDKEAYPNFLEDFRTAAPNYYMAAAAVAHHRSTPETSEKQARSAHQSNNPQNPGYPFLGAPQPRPPSYSLGAPFMPPHQAPLMDANSPLYQQYLQAGVLHQGLLGPPGAYTPGYHPALSMRQPYDSMTRPPWL